MFYLVKFLVKFFRHNKQISSKACSVILIVVWLLVIYVAATLVVPLIDYYYLSETTHTFISGSEEFITTKQETILFEETNKYVYLNTDRLLNLQSGDIVVVTETVITRKVISISFEDKYIYHVKRSRPELGAICALLIPLFIGAGAFSVYLVKTKM